MPTGKNDRENLRDDISRSQERSPLFWFLLENYEWINEQANGRRLPWKKLCVRFEEMGVTNRVGNFPEPRAAKLTWQRVRKEVARMTLRAEAAEAAKRAKEAEKDRRGASASGTGLVLRREPPLPAARNDPILPSVIRNKNTGLMPWEAEGLTDQERANIKRGMEGAMKSMAHMDRWVNPPKKD